MIQGHDSWIGAMARAMDALVLTADYTGTVIAWGCNGSEPKPEWKIDAHPSTIYYYRSAGMATPSLRQIGMVWSASGGRVMEASSANYPDSNSQPMEWPSTLMESRLSSLTANLRSRSNCGISHGKLSDCPSM